MHLLDLPDTLVLHQGAVELRTLTFRDAAELTAAAAEGRSHFGFTPVPNGLEATQAYITKAYQMHNNGERQAFAIRWHGRVVGTTSFVNIETWAWPAGSSLARHPHPDALEIGHTWLAQSALRTQVNTTAKYLLLRHAFETWQVHRVRLRTDRRNERSQRAIARLGLQHDGILRGDRAASDGGVRDSVFFSLLAPEWPATRVHLETLLERAAVAT